MTYRIEKLGLLLQEAEKHLRRRLEARTASHGLSIAQWRLLGHLMREGPTTQVALADLLDVEPISVSRLIDRMENAGWVRREAHPEDRRARIILATDKAREIAPGVKAIAMEIYDQALTGLSDEERRIFHAALQRVIANSDKNRPLPAATTAGAQAKAEIETTK